MKKHLAHVGRVENCLELASYENRGLAGNYSHPLPLPGVVLFAWVCNNGPFNGGVPKIDALHVAQGKERAQLGLSLQFGAENFAEHEDGCAIIGLYDRGRDLLNWVEIINAPDTLGVHRGAIMVDRGLVQHNTDQHEARVTIPNTDGRPWVVIYYSPNQPDHQRIDFRFERP